MQRYRSTYQGDSPRSPTPRSRGESGRVPSASRSYAASSRVASARDSVSRMGSYLGAASGARSGAYEPRRSTGAASARSHVGDRAARATDFMRYANDNALIRAVYAFVTGPTKIAFYGIVCVFAAVSIYLPVREYYIACRMNDIYSQQLAQHEAYNAALEEDVDKLMSREGIADEAHRRFGYVMPGETSGEVVGLNEDGTPQQQGSGSDGDQAVAGSTDAADSDDFDAEGTTSDGSDENAAAEKSSSVPQNVADGQSLDDVTSPWYCSVLDVVFFFPGMDGQQVASTGESS